MARIAQVADLGNFPIIEVADMTIGELADAERISGLTIDQILLKNTAGVSLAMLYIAIRRVNPSQSERQIRLIPSRDLHIKDEDEVASDPPAEGAGA